MVLLGVVNLIVWFSGLMCFYFILNAKEGVMFVQVLVSMPCGDAFAKPQQIT